MIIKYKLLMFISFFLCYGCNTNKEEAGKTALVKIEVKNSSTKNVRILLFFPNDSLFKDVNINATDSLIVEEGLLRPAPTGPTYKLTNHLDSAEIIFSDGKKLIQTLGLRGNRDLTNNILQDLHYKYFQSHNPEFTRKRFTITQDDYLRAK